jgi:hypothetical protein
MEKPYDDYPPLSTLRLLGLRQGFGALEGVILPEKIHRKFVSL